MTRVWITAIVALLAFSTGCATIRGSGGWEYKFVTVGSEAAGRKEYKKDALAAAKATEMSTDGWILDSVETVAVRPRWDPHSKPDEEGYLLIFKRPKR